MISKNAMKMLAVTFVAAITLLLVGSTFDSYPADNIFNPTHWNGYRIYLSRGHAEGGGGVGCDGFIERIGASAVSWEAAVGYGNDFVSRGYKVRIGNGDQWTNIDRSNGWPSHRHIALHSDGIGNPGDCLGGNNLYYGASGTQVFYYPGSSKGYDLANELKERVGKSTLYNAVPSPGRGKDNVNTAYYNELVYTDMPAAYMEYGFHTFRPDKNWIVRDYDWAWQIGWAVDMHLGYP